MKYKMSTVKDSLGKPLTVNFNIILDVRVFQTGDITQ